MTKSQTVEEIEGDWTLALCGLVGSKAYGLDTASSDSDYLGVYQVDTTEFFKLSPPKQTATNTDRIHPGTPDYTYHELGKFVSLALNCNPTILEALWLDDYTHLDEVGQTLVSMREDFLSERARETFGGYARSQLHRMKTYQQPQERDEKYVRHMFRLLEEGAHLLRTGVLKVKVDDPEELFALGRLGYDEVLEEFTKRAALFEKTKSVLPERPNRDKVGDFLMEARLRGLPWPKEATEQVENLKDVLRTLRRMMAQPGGGFKTLGDV